IGGALVNLAAMFAGKVPVNLNYTASQPVVDSCAQQSGLTATVTSHAFLEKIKIQPPGKAVYLEDLAEKPRFSEKIVSLLAALFLPARSIEKLAGAKQKPSLDDLATIIFSSGSTRGHKGRVPPHFHIASNV